VLEAGHFIPPKHRSILVDLLDLEHIAVEDVMIPRRQIEAVDIEADWEDLLSQLVTSHHSRLPVYRGDIGSILGVLSLKRLVPLLHNGELNREALIDHLQPPYFIPAGTPVFTQLQFFQENRQRVGMVVDEYGEIIGLLTLEDIIEEFVGEFTTSMPGGASTLEWDDEGAVLIEGGRELRELNRKLGLDLPTDGPRTLNGLIIEHFQDIPEAGVTLKIGDTPIEIIQTEDRNVKTAKIFRPRR
jgi:Mg2+/Co2+ transporter CorB